MAQKLISDSAEITLGYWGIRGLGQPIRFLLVYAGIPFSETRLGVLQDGTILNKNKEGDDWAWVRETLDMPFRNLPYLIDTSGPTPISMTQSNAILRYLARRFDLYGDSESDRVEIDVLQEQAYDFRNKIVKTAYTLGDEYPNAYNEFVENVLPNYLDGFENYLTKRSDHSFFVGTRLSLVDCVLYELIWQMTVMVPGSVSTSNRPCLFKFIQNFEQLPEIVAYMQSENYIERPINSPWASFT